MNESDDLISVLTEEHRDQRQLLTELEYLTEGEPLWRSLADLTIAELVRHVVAEDAYLHPVARDRLPKGHRITDHQTAEHQEVERTLKELERHDLPCEEFASLVARLDGEVRAHMRFEEEQLFPLLARHLSKEELAALGRKALEAKEEASIEQRFSECAENATLASGTGLVDRVRTYLCSHGYAL